MTIFYSERQGYPGFFRGTEDCVIATAAQDMWEWAERVSAQLREVVGPIAMIGGGFAVLPRVAARPMDIYEIEPRVAEETRRQAPLCRVIVGDYRQTLARPYAAIVYDLDHPPTEAERSFLSAHLAPGGVILGAPLE
jgi:hypothetical protein